MARRSEFIPYKLSERDHEKRGIHAARLKRILPGFAERHGLDVNPLIEIAERTFYLCSICLGPVVKVYLYPDASAPLGILCGRCDAAVKETGGQLTLIRKHWRFRSDRLESRARLGRLVSLHSG